MRLFFTTMCGPGSLTDLRELWDPIKGYFAGLSVVYFGAREDEEAQYLEANKGEGIVIYLPYVGRHDLARTVAIHSGVIQDGDWIVQCDTLERIPASFIANHVAPWYGLTGMQPNCWYYHNKPLVFKYHESLRYEGTPHEGLRRDDGQMRSLELNQMEIFKDEAQVRLNVRPLKRDKWHFVKHYGRYALLPWGSNHYLLPLSGKPDAQRLFEERERARLVFIDLIRELGIKRDVDSVVAYMKTGKMDERFIRHVETDKIWNDIYRVYVLGRQDIVDNHDWSNVVKVISP